MNEYEVNFLISGNYNITAANEDEARQIVNDIINGRIDILEKSILNTGLKDDDYTTDVIKI